VKALILLLIAAVASAAPHRIGNALVKVTDETIRPGKRTTWPGKHPTLIVYLTGGTLMITDGAGGKATNSFHRGEVDFEAARTRRVTNVSATKVHYVRIEFLGEGVDDNWGATGLSPNYKVLLENRYTRAYDIRIPAGTKEPQHTHHDRVVVCLNGATLKHLMPDGRVEPSTLATGEIAWRRGGTHIGHNLGKTDLWVIAVEPK